jgi:hypothetical protein
MIWPRRRGESVQDLPREHIIKILRSQDIKIPINQTDRGSESHSQWFYERRKTGKKHERQRAREGGRRRRVGKGRWRPPPYLIPLAPPSTSQSFLDERTRTVERHARKQWPETPRPHLVPNPAPHHPSPPPTTTTTTVIDAQYKDKERQAECHIWRFNTAEIP